MHHVWAGGIGLIVCRAVYNRYSTKPEKQSAPIVETVTEIIGAPADAPDQLFSQATEKFLAKVAPNKSSTEYAYLKGVLRYLYQLSNEDMPLMLATASEKFLDEVGIMVYHLPVVGQKICLAEAENLVKMLEGELEKEAI